MHLFDEEGVNLIKSLLVIGLSKSLFWFFPLKLKNFCTSLANFLGLNLQGML